jgi:hypothetical protein
MFSSFLPGSAGGGSVFGFLERCDELVLGDVSGCDRFGLATLQRLDEG